MEREPKRSSEKKQTGNRVFFVERSRYSEPQVIVIVAANLKEANEVWGKMLEEENNLPEDFDKLKELNLNKHQILMLTPPGDRHLER